MILRFPSIWALAIPFQDRTYIFVLVSPGDSQVQPLSTTPSLWSCFPTQMVLRGPLAQVCVSGNKCSNLGLVFVSLGHSEKILQPAQLLNNRHFSLGCWEGQDQGADRFSAGWVQLAGSKTLPSQGRGAEGTFLGLFTRALILFMKPMPP